MTYQAKQKIAKEILDYHACAEGDCEHQTHADCYYELLKHGAEIGYSTAMSEAQGLIDAIEYVQSGLLFSDLDTQARSNALDKIDHAIKQFRQEIKRGEG